MNQLEKQGVSYETIRPLLNSFDLIFFRGTGALSRIISLTQECLNGQGAGGYTHVGMIILGTSFPPESPYHSRVAVYIFESLPGNHSGRFSNDGVPNMQGMFPSGVQLRNFDNVAAAYDQNKHAKLGWCRMNSETRAKINASAWSAIFEQYNGTAYENCLHLVASACCCLRPFRQCFRSMCCYSKSTERQICSELVTNVYKDLNALPNTVNAENVIPADFIKKPGKNKTFDVDREIPVMFEELVLFTLNPIKDVEISARA